MNPYPAKLYPLNTLLLVVVFLIPVWPSYYAIKVDPLPGFDLTRLLIFLLASLWFLTLLARPRLMSRLIHIVYVNRVPFLLLLLPFFAWKLLTTTSSSHMLHAIFSALKDSIYYFLLFLIALTVWKTREHLHLVVKSMVVASILVSVVTCIEYIFQHNFLAAIVPSQYENLKSSVESLFRDNSYRAEGTFSQSLALASYAVVILPVSVWCFLQYSGWWKQINLISIVGLIACVFATGSRGGLAVLAFMVAGAAFFLFYHWKMKSKRDMKMLIMVLMVFVGSASSVGAILIGSELASGRTEKEAGSTDIRLKQIEWGVPIILRHPFMGYGPGEAGSVLGISTGTVDNYYLTLALESGLPALLLFIGTLLFFLCTAWRQFHMSKTPWSGLSVALLVSIAGSALFMAVLSLEQTIPLLFLMFAMVLVLNTDHDLFEKGERSEWIVAGDSNR